MRAGKAIRDARALAHAYEKPCSCCGHRMGGHRELLAETYEITDGAVVTVPNPDYKPLHFHCNVEGCACVVIESGSRN